MVYLIMCRSLTYAQRVSNALERAGIPARVLRSPGEISPTGCSYSVKIAARNLARALTILNGTRLPYLGIYVNAAGYGYRRWNCDLFGQCRHHVSKAPCCIPGSPGAMASMTSPGRGTYGPAARASRTLLACREEAAALFQVGQPERVVLTFNATLWAEHCRAFPGKAGSHGAPVGI
ncbi:MAG: putative Se/S carrier-like protein [Evtepia gabavorous]